MIFKEFIKLKGYQNNSDYQTAKAPLEKWQEKKYNIKNNDDLIILKNHLKNGGWIGTIIPDNVICIDIDDKNDGNLIKKIIEKLNIQSLIIETPRGFQFFFYYNYEKNITNSADILTKSFFKVDYRIADKGYIVYPTKNTENRKIIKDINNINSLSVLPFWLEPLKNKKADFEVKYPLYEGARNDTLFKISQKLLNFLPENETLKIINFINDNLVEPPLDKKEIENLAKKRENYNYENNFIKEIKKQKKVENKDVEDFKENLNNEIENICKNITIFLTKKDAMENYNLFKNLFLENIYDINQNILNIETKLLSCFGYSIKNDYLCFLKEQSKWYLNTKKGVWIQIDNYIEHISDLFYNFCFLLLKDIDNTFLNLKTKIYKIATKETTEKTTKMEKTLRNFCSVSINEFDVNKNEINCLNGVFFIDNNNNLQFRNHKKDDKFLKQIKINFTKKSYKNTKWELFLKEITQNNIEKQNYLKKLAGYCITGLTGEQSIYFLVGNGANGKTTFLNVLYKIFGDYSKIISAQTLLQKNNQNTTNDIAKLIGSRFVLGSELPSEAKMDETLLKSLAGGENITARFLFQEYFEFKPMFKIVFATNHKPHINDFSEGFWRKIKIINFDFTIPEEKREKEIDEKLFSEEKEEIFAWVIEGLIEYIAEGLKNYKEMSDEIKKFKEDLDVLGEFVNQCITLNNEKYKLKVSEIYNRFKDYLKENGYKEWSIRKFSLEFSSRFKIEKIRLGDGKYFKNIGFKSQNLDDYSVIQNE